MFGLNFNTNKSSDVVKDAERILNSEIMSINELESRLMNELKNLDHMKNNISLLKSNLLSIRKLSELREKAIYGLTREAVNNRQKFNIERYNELKNTILKIDKDFFPLITITYREAQKLNVEDTHALYAEESNRKNMDEIDQESKDIIAEINIIDAKHQSLSVRIANIDKDIQKIILERQTEEPKKTSNIGF